MATKDEIKAAFLAGYHAALALDYPGKIGADDAAWQQSAIRAALDETCCGLPLTADGFCRLSGEKVRRNAGTQN